MIPLKSERQLGAVCLCNHWVAAESVKVESFTCLLHSYTVNQKKQQQTASIHKSIKF